MGIHVTELDASRKKSRWDDDFSVREAREAKKFHSTLDEYHPTPLWKLDAFARYLNLKQFYIKDESFRLGLNAFKGLGGSYALKRVIEGQLGISISHMTDIPADMFTFVTATDGNHGRGVAWAARKFSQKAVVYMPKGSSAERLENIRELGAHAEITEFNYDDTVRFARTQAEKNHWILVQDTAWPGYETVPLWIMQGYMTMALEAVEQLNGIVPTHIFLQAGVGAMAGALAGFFSNLYKEDPPKIIIAEPENANCVFMTAKANDGALHKINGELRSIMAGLCCGEVCTIGWDILKEHANYFFSCSDDVAGDGMRILGNPLTGDERVISGESGAVTTGLVYRLMTKSCYSGICQNMELGSDSVVLCFNTEGATDQENYRHVVWDGWYSK